MQLWKGREPENPFPVICGSSEEEEMKYRN